ncbi:MAG: RNA polymerase sigma factor [Roseovarius sp.]
MYPERIHTTAAVTRHEAETKLIECRNKFLGFIRKRLRNPRDAEDIFQEFCVKVLRNHATIKNGERLDAWLAITLRHTLTDHYRRQAARSRATEAYVSEAKILSPETEPSSGDVDEPACSCIQAAMQDLQPAHAQLLTRLDLREESRDKVATDLAVTHNALRVRVHRARLALKKRIAEICPTCGEGRFMQCDGDQSRETHNRTEMAF